MFVNLPQKDSATNFGVAIIQPACPVSDRICWPDRTFSPDAVAWAMPVSDGSFGGKSVLRMRRDLRIGSDHAQVPRQAPPSIEEQGDGRRARRRGAHARTGGRAGRHGTVLARVAGPGLALVAAVAVVAVV